MGVPGALLRSWTTIRTADLLVFRRAGVQRKKHRYYVPAHAEFVL